MCSSDLFPSHDTPAKQMYVSAQEIEEALLGKKNVDRPAATPIVKRPVTNEVIEVDLHINELLDNTANMSNKEILDYQLGEFHKVLEENKNKKGQKIVFIHGKGDGVLRKSILDELKHKYKTYQSQDASFKEYIYGKGVGSGQGSMTFNTGSGYYIIMCIYHATPLLDYAISGPDGQNLVTSIEDLPIPEFDNWYGVGSCC